MFTAEIRSAALTHAAVVHVETIEAFRFLNPGRLAG